MTEISKVHVKIATLNQDLFWKGANAPRAILQAIFPKTQRATVSLLSALLHDHPGNISTLERRSKIA